MINNLPKSLIETAKSHTEHLLYESIILTEDRISFLKEKHPVIDTTHDTKAKSWDTTASQVIDHLADKADPTKKKIHTQWLLNQYKKKNIRLEDSPRIKEALGNFEKYKGKLEKRDINQYSTISDVETAVHPHIGTASSKAEAKADTNTKGRTLVHDNGAGLQVFRLEPNEHGKKASQDIYGGGHESGGTHTSWCTAARSQQCMFDHYSKDQPLHVIHTPDGEVYQAHPKTNQLMDRRDEEVTGTKYNYNDQEIKHKNGEHIANALDHIPDGHVLKITRSLPNVTANDIKKTFDDDNEVNDTTLIMATEHPAATPEILHKAAEHPAGIIREAAMHNPNVTKEVLQKGLNDKASLVRNAAIRHPSTSAETLSTIYNNNQDENGWSTRRVVLSHKNAPQHILRHAIEHGTRSDVEAAIKNDIADADTINFAVTHNAPSTHDAIAEHPNATPHALNILLHNHGFQNQYSAAKAARNRNASPDNITKAMNHNESMVRAEAIRNPNATTEHLFNAMRDTDSNVGRNAFQSPKITPEHIEMGINHASPTVRAAAVMHKNATKEQLDRAIRHVHANVRAAAARNPNISHEQMDYLKNDTDVSVKNSLGKNMKFVQKEMDELGL